MSDLPLPPEELRRVGRAPDYEQIGKNILEMLKIHGLRPDDRVLDVGCGIGRVAIHMTQYLESGSYEGFDIVKEGIEWCQENITPEHPSFRFQHSDVYNKFYNPDGVVTPEAFRFPYPDDDFDFAFLTSVFTHMLPDGLENYLREVTRVLRPGGRCVITYFLLDRKTVRLIKDGKTRPKFQHKLGRVRITKKHAPEASVAYHARYIYKLYKKNGLNIETERRGAWRGSEWFGRQDLILATKVKPG